MGRGASPGLTHRYSSNECEIQSEGQRHTNNASAPLRCQDSDPKSRRFLSRDRLVSSERTIVRPVFSLGIEAGIYHARIIYLVYFVHLCCLRMDHRKRSSGMFSPYALKTWL